MPLTLAIAFSTLVFMYAISIPVGIYAAVQRYSIGDYTSSFIGYLGLATPNFLLALVLMYLGQRYFGQSAGGLFSPAFANAPWGWAKFWDMLKHLAVPVVVLGTAGTAFLIRAMRAAVLDELDKMYVLSAKASGLSPLQLLIRYPVRVALEPDREHARLASHLRHLRRADRRLRAGAPRHRPALPRRAAQSGYAARRAR